MWKLYVASLDDIKSHFFKWRNFPLLSLLSHVVSPAAATAAPLLPLALYLRRGRRRWQYYYHRRGGAAATAFTEAMVLLGQLLRASSFPGTLAHEEILPHHYWVDFSTCNRRAVRSPNREQERPEQVKPANAQSSQNSTFFYLGKSRTILALHICYLLAHII